MKCGKFRPRCPVKSSTAKLWDFGVKSGLEIVGVDDHLFKGNARLVVHDNSDDPAALVTAGSPTEKHDPVATHSRLQAIVLARLGRALGKKLGFF